MFKRKSRKKKALLIFIFIIVFCWINRVSILQGAGNFLICEDPIESNSTLVVLGGNSHERGLEAAQLHRKDGYESYICTGGNIPSVLEAIDTLLYEADITKSLLVTQGVPNNLVTALKGSTSTKEEAKEVLDYSISNNIKSLTILSSKFHLRRVKMVFDQEFEGTGIDLHYRGANPLQYDVDAWWKSEQGLIMVNNEYVKWIFYKIKY